jgi:hypothetical protein
VDVKLLHVVRTDGPPPAALAADDWIVYRQPDRWWLDGRGDPPIPSGSIDHATLVTLVTTADRVIVW